MLNDFIKELTDRLNNYRDHQEHVDEQLKSKIEEIIADYKQMYEDALASGLSDEQVVWKLGTPLSIVTELGLSLPAEDADSRGWRNKVVALTPFIAVITYFGLGFGLSLWHPGWLVFLLIPVTAILLNAEGIFTKIISLSPFAALIAFFVLVEMGYAHVGWLVFLVIPMIGMTSEKRVWRAIAFEVAMLISIAGYLYMVLVLDRIEDAYLAFSPLVIYFFTYPETYRQIAKLFTNIMGWVVIGVSVTYIVLGYAFDAWYWAWLLFLLIPSTAIILHAGRKARLVALSPFIATVIFFTLGFALNGWSYAWIAYLLIPIIAIIDGRS